MHLHQDQYVQHAYRAQCDRPLPTIFVYTVCHLLATAVNSHLTRIHIHTGLYCDIITDLSTRRSYPCFTKDRGAAELIKSFSTLFQSHPEWKPSLPGVDRFVRADAEKSYRSAEFLQCLHNFGYRLEPTPPRDKHANGIVGRAVGVLSMKCNITMQPLGMTVPQKFWDLALSIHASPMHSITIQQLRHHRIISSLESM